MSQRLPGIELTHRFFRDWYARLRAGGKEVEYEPCPRDKWGRAKVRSFERAVLEADAVLIELRYGLTESLWKRPYYTFYVGDEGEDFAYLYLGGEWVAPDHSLSYGDSGSRSFANDFYWLLLKREKPTYVVIHDMTRGEVFPRAVPFERLGALENTCFGHAIPRPWLAMVRANVQLGGPAKKRGGTSR